MKFTLEKHATTLALAVAVSFTAALSARAQLIASEGFNYAPGTAVIATEGTGGTGWGSGWVSKSDTAQSQVVGTSLSYTDGSGNILTTSGGSLISSTLTSTTAQPQRALPSTFGALAAANTAASGTLWMSYLWQGLNTTGSGSGWYRQAIMMFINGATSAVNGSGSERLDIGMPNISTANLSTVNPNISLWTSGGLSAGNTYSSTAPLQSTVAANSGLTTFVLIEMVLDNTTTTPDTVNVWLNPTLTGTTPVGSPNLTYSSQDLSAINGIRIQSGSLNTSYGTVGGEQQVDEINIGDTVADVEPVPEPGSMALGALGGLALLALRRKQQ
jgi:hypothetical protein